jgi:ribose transport system substrate-binding protein
MAAVRQAMAAPAGIGITTPLTSKPPAGKTIVWLQCDAPQCMQVTQAFEPAVAAVGWHLKTVGYQSANPATLVAAMKQALQYHPVAVSLVAEPYAVWQSEVPAYKAAGVAIIPQEVGAAPVDSTVIANIQDPTALGAQAEAIANWVIADSGGKGHVLLYSVPDFTSILSYQQAFQAYMTSHCSGCSVTLLAQSAAQSLGGAANPGIVSAIQRDPSITYAVSVDLQLTPGLEGSLTAAGIQGVKVAGSFMGQRDEAAIASGSVAAGTPQALNITAWRTVDAALRHLEGLPIAPGDGPFGTQLLVRSNVGTPSDSYSQPPNYQAQYEQLWKVG